MQSVIRRIIAEMFRTIVISENTLEFGTTEHILYLRPYKILTTVIVIFMNNCSWKFENPSFRGDENESILEIATDTDVCFWFPF